MTFPGATSGYQAGAQANDSTIAYALESTYGTAATGAYQLTRFTGENFRRQKLRSRPDEINTTYEAAQAVTTQDAASGTLSGALSAGTYDDLLAGVQMADFNSPFSQTTSSTAQVKVGDGTGNVPVGSISLSFPALKSTYSGTLVVGQVVKITGFSNAGNNGAFRVTAVYAPATGAGWNFWIVNDAAVNETATGSVTVSHGGFNQNGSLFKSFTVREPMAGGFWTRTGGFISRAQFSWSQGAFATSSFDFMFAGETRVSTDPAASLSAAPTGTVMDTIKGFGGMWINGVAQGGVRSVSASLTRDGAAQDFAMGSALAAGQRPGSMLVSGTVQKFFRTDAEYQLFAAETVVPVTWVVRDGTGSGYAFTLPAATLQNPQVNAGSKNSTVLASFDLEANPQPGGGSVIIQRF